MIVVKKINNSEVVINAELIEGIEIQGDTIISLTTGNKIRVKETPEEIVAKVITYKRSLLKPKHRD